MSYKLCCGALNVSQLTIPALPTSEIERIGNDDSSTADTDSLTDQLNYDDEPSGVSTTVCEDEITDSDLHNELRQEDTAIAAVSETSVTKPVVRKKIKSATVGHKKGEKIKDLSKKKNKFFAWKRKKRFPPPALRVEERSSSLPENNQTKSCVCTGFKKTEESLLDTASAACASCSVVDSLPSSGRTSPQLPSVSRLTMGAGPSPSSLSVELRRMVPPPPRAHTSAAFAAVLAARGPAANGGEMDDDQARIAQRIHDIELGIEINRGHSAYPHFQYPSARNSLSASSSSTNSDSLWSLTCSFQNQCAVSVPRYPITENQPSGLTTFGQGGRFSDLGAGPSQSLLSVPPPGPCIPRTEYTQVDYIHCLVPDLARIANCSFYWGVMDRYEAERLLDNRAEGTFLLRDSAQDDFLFSVSFRRYGRSLHARIDQWNHKFSFDTHDPGVFAATTVTGLIEHYKDPNCCMFFEPMLTIPLGRKFPFSLQHLCRSEICGKTTYDGLSYLPLPKSLVQYLKYYHYKQKVRVRHMQVFN